VKLHCLEVIVKTTLGVIIQIQAYKRKEMVLLDTAVMLDSYLTSQMVSINFAMVMKNILREATTCFMEREQYSAKRADFKIVEDLTCLCAVIHPQGRWATVEDLRERIFDLRSMPFYGSDFRDMII
jgi:hypothetical protein